MQMQRHDTAACPVCCARLWFGLKAEPNGWKVYYECDECRFEKLVGRVSIESVSGRDEAQMKAESMGKQI